MGVRGRLTLALCAALVALAALALPASSHVLRKSAIRAGVKVWVKESCNQRIRDCKAWSVGRCSQRSAHRIICDARVRGGNAVDGEYVCDFHVNVRAHPREYRYWIWNSNVRCTTEHFTPRPLAGATAAP
jgi:hypothetical protein